MSVYTVDKQLRAENHKIIVRLATYIVWEIARLLDERESLSLELLEERSRNKGKEKTELMKHLEGEIEWRQARLSKIAQDHEWVEKALHDAR